MIQTCALCGSEWEDQKYDHCVQCCGKNWKSATRLNFIFNSIEQIGIVANIRQTEYESLNDQINQQQQKINEETEKLRDLEMKYEDTRRDSEDLFHHIDGIKRRKIFIAEISVKEEIKIIK